MHKKSIFVLLVLCSIGLFYTAFKNNDSWVINDSPRTGSPYDFSEAELLKLIYKDLRRLRVNYAASVKQNDSIAPDTAKYIVMSLINISK